MLAYVGPNPDIVNDVIEMARFRPLLFAADVPEHLKKLVEVVDAPPKWEWDTGVYGHPTAQFEADEVSYRDIREWCAAETNIPEISFAVESLHDIFLEPQMIESIKLRLPPRYRRYLDWILSDLLDLSLARAAFGKRNKLEWMYDIYFCGGWPVGWRGHWPDGKPLVVFPGVK